MAKEIKPGKKFKYNLQAVLKVRGIREKKEQEKFAEKKRVFNTEKEKEDALKEKDRVRKGELKTILKPGPIKDFASIMRRRAHLGALKEDIEKQVEKVIDASNKLNDQRNKLIDAMKDKKIMEVHKEKQHGLFKKAVQDLELKFLDEIATQRFQHGKIENEKSKKS
jgi:flagellar FliJ protein